MDHCGLDLAPLFYFFCNNNRLNMNNMKKEQYETPEQMVIKMNVRHAICDFSATGDDPTQGGDD